MRKWHRWLAVLAGIFVFWVAATGFVGQVVSLSGGEHHGPPTADRQNLQRESISPGHDSSMGKHAYKPQDLYHLIIDLHSGAYFGFLGKLISALVGSAVLFFSISGMWMYADMYRKRKRNGRSGIFWK